MCVCVWWPGPGDFRTLEQASGGRKVLIKIGGAPPPAEAVCGSEKKVQQCLFVGKEFVSWDFFFFFFFFKISSDCKYKYVPKCGALGKYKPLTVKAILGTTKLCLEDRRVAAQVRG